MVQVLALSFKLETTLFCKSFIPLRFLIVLLDLFTLNLSGFIAKLSAKGQVGMTTLQKEILRFVAIIGSFAIGVSILIVILWAAWYVEYQTDFQHYSGNNNNVTGFVVLSQVPLTYPLFLSMLSLSWVCYIPFPILLSFFY